MTTESKTNRSPEQKAQPSKPIPLLDQDDRALLAQYDLMFEGRPQPQGPGAPPPEATPTQSDWVADLEAKRPAPELRDTTEEPESVVSERSDLDHDVEQPSQHAPDPSNEEAVEVEATEAEVAEAEAVEVKATEDIAEGDAFVERADEEPEEELEAQVDKDTDSTEEPLTNEDTLDEWLDPEGPRREEEDEEQVVVDNTDGAVETEAQDTGLQGLFDTRTFDQRAPESQPPARAVPRLEPGEHHEMARRLLERKNFFGAKPTDSRPFGFESDSGASSPFDTEPASEVPAHAHNELEHPVEPPALPEVVDDEEVATLSGKRIKLLVALVVGGLLIASWLVGQIEVKSDEVQVEEVSTSTADLDDARSRAQQKLAQTEKVEEKPPEPTEAPEEKPEPKPPEEIKTFVAGEGGEAQAPPVASAPPVAREPDPWEVAARDARAIQAKRFHEERLAATHAPLFFASGRPSNERAGGAARAGSSPGAYGGMGAGRVQPMAPTGTHAGAGLAGAGAASVGQGRAPRDTRAEREAFFARGEGQIANWNAGSEHDGQVVAMGEVVQIVLLTELSSELPGNIMGQVTSPVYDRTLTNILIPAGTRVIGTYRAGADPGQERLQFAWSALTFSDGSRIDVPHFPGVDMAGASGRQARVNERLGRVGMGIGLSALVKGGSAAVSGPSSSLDVRPGQQALSAGTDAATRATDALATRYLELDPTLELPAGSVVGMWVATDLLVPRRATR